MTNQEQWLEIARQVVQGRQKQADGSTLKSMWLGLRGIDHPEARRACEMLVRWLKHEKD